MTTCATRAVPAQSITPHEALSRLFAQCRSKFDECLLAAFIKMMGIYPPGSVVQLSDERFAMVMTVNAAHPLKPRVLVYDPGVPSRGGGAPRSGAGARSWASAAA